MINNKKKIPNVAAKPIRAADILRDLDCETVTLNGVEVSMLEAHLRLLYARSLNGKIGAAVELQRIRDRCDTENPVKVGVLVVPETASEEDWERRAIKSQARYRVPVNLDEEY